MKLFYTIFGRSSFIVFERYSEVSSNRARARVEPAAAAAAVRATLQSSHLARRLQVLALKQYFSAAPHHLQRLRLLTTPSLSVRAPCRGDVATVKEGGLGYAKCGKVKLKT
jgi:hypothetical protein